MKTRKQIYHKEAAELLRHITAYHYIRKDQLLRMYPGKEQKIEQLLIFLTKQVRIQYDEARGLYHDDSQIPLDMEMLAALWVLVDFIGRVEYHSPVDFPGKLVFVADGELYEVLYLPLEKSAAIEYAAAGQERDPGKRIVIVENADQIKELHIPSVAAYCTVDMDSGTVSYYRQEVSDG